MAKKILLADDSITIQKVISLSFASEDFELIIVSDGNSAIDKARETMPDLVMADVAMPGKSGYEVCEVIKRDPELGKVPVMLLAGTFEPLDTAEAERVGADDHIVKPFESEELLGKVIELLSKPAKAAASAPPPAEAAAPPQPAQPQAAPEQAPQPQAQAPAEPPAQPSVSDDIWEAGDFLASPTEEESSAPQQAQQQAQPSAPEPDVSDFFDLDLSEEDEVKPEPPQPEPQAPPQQQAPPPQPEPQAPPQQQAPPPQPEPQAPPQQQAPPPQPEPQAPPQQQAPPPQPEPQPAQVAPSDAAAEAMGAMSKEEIEAIVNKVAREVVEEVVWEVVPDMTEELIRSQLIDKVREAMGKAK